MRRSRNSGKRTTYWSSAWPNGPPNWPKPTATWKAKSPNASRPSGWLLESEQRFRGYFEQGLVGMAILTAEREWVEVNGRLCKMLGYPEEELLLKTWQDLTHPEDRPAAEAEFQRLLGGVVRGFVADTRLVRKDGRIFPAGLSAQCLQKADGTIDCILILVQDMTHRNQA